jgi:hypothetical protein
MCSAAGQTARAGTCCRMSCLCEIKM